MNTGKLQKLYINPETFTYYSPRYGKSITVEEAYRSDGATGARDISGPYYGTSRAWWVHDVMRDAEQWDDGTPCTNVQASWVLYDILKSEGRWFRARTWLLATWFFGETKELLAGRTPRPPEPPNICFSG